MNRLSLWLILFFSISVLSGLIYGSMQQEYRQSANHPQISMVETTVSAILNGQNPNLLIPSATVDITSSLEPWIMLYDQKGELFGTNARLDGIKPTVPAGVLDYTRQHRQDRVTWQPKPDVRSAIIAVAYTNSSQSGYVVAGRSLQEVEVREKQLTKMVFWGWLVGVIASLLVFVPWVNVARFKK